MNKKLKEELKKEFWKKVRQWFLLKGEIILPEAREDLDKLFQTKLQQILTQDREESESNYDAGYRTGFKRGKRSNDDYPRGYQKGYIAGRKWAGKLTQDREEAYKKGRDEALDEEFKESKTRADIAKKNYSMGYNDALKGRKKAPHNTREGYCCACEYDIACMKEEIKKDREKIIKLAKSMTRKCPYAPERDKEVYVELNEFIKLLKGGEKIMSDFAQEPRKLKEVAICGYVKSTDSTNRGQKRHLRMGEKPCADCASAYRNYMRSWRNKFFKANQ